MADMMTFPETVEEFMEQYKITDTEQIYTNGTELVPIFRMKQWFEHLPSAEPKIIRCKDCKFCKLTGFTEHICCNAESWVVATDLNFGCIFAERAEG